MEIHMLGIGGVGMAALAWLLKRRGHEVSGCDAHLGPRTRWLEANGIPVLEGHSPEHAGAVRPELAVVTPAVAADNPELRALAASGVAIRSRGEMLAGIVSDCDSIAVCGSHGKTTTATFVAKLLAALGENAEWAIGGETGSFPVAGRVRPDEPASVLVAEADESDGTLAAYRAGLLVVTNCEYDHPDHFPTPADYAACFDRARRQARDVVEGVAVSMAEAERYPCLRSLAEHNRRNALVAVAVARRRGHSEAAIAAALPAAVAELPDRRFQMLATGVYTDYAHHPTEMKCAVAMARTACRGKLRVLFQPHRYSRTKALLRDFPAALAGADEVVLCPTYAAFERPVEGGDVADLYRACRERFAASAAAPRLYLARTCGEAWEHARNSWAEGDLTLLLGAGDIIGLTERIQREMSGILPPKRVVWQGMGTNTLRDDLRTDVEYRRTAGPADRPGATLGIPWMTGIPGTVGGWIKMNAGAFGHSFSEVLDAVDVDGRWIPASECGFGYRTSNIHGEIRDFRLKPNLDFGGETAADYLKRRRRFPAGTKGSVFKNPPGDFAGRLLEAAGCKELRVGGARVWSEHANVIVSGPGATADDFRALAGLMRERVRFRFGVELECEVRNVF